MTQNEDKQVLSGQFPVKIYLHCITVIFAPGPFPECNQRTGQINTYVTVSAFHVIVFRSFQIVLITKYLLPLNDFKHCSTLLFLCPSKFACLTFLIVAAIDILTVFATLAAKKKVESVAYFQNLSLQNTASRASNTETIIEQTSSLVWICHIASFSISMSSLSNVQEHETLF